MFDVRNDGFLDAAGALAAGAQWPEVVDDCRRR
jgi:hypothetical protein